MKRAGYLLDTNVVSFWFANEQGIKARIESLPGSDLVYVSVVTIGEIEFGHTNASATDGQKQMRFLRTIKKMFHMPFLGIEEGDAWEYARFKRSVFDITDTQGKYTENRTDSLGQKCNIDENDLWLVAQAYSRNLTLVTTDSMKIIRDAVGHEVDIDVWPAP